MYPVVNVGDLTKPATVLIEKVSSAVGLLWEPQQIRRIAQAKADERMILAKSQIEVDEVMRRAAIRFVEEETKQQLNMENIGSKALPHVGTTAPVEDVENDWIVNFFDKCRTVSDNDMQDLWGRILAGEANSPGSFSRKTVNLVSDLDRESAELFVNLCSFGWTIRGAFVPFIFDDTQQMYNRQGLALFSLGLLNSIGLIHLSSIGFNLRTLPKTAIATYHGKSVELTFPKEDGNELAVGTVILTPPGEQLSRIIKASPIEGFLSSCIANGRRNRLCPLWKTGQGHSRIDPARNRVPPRTGFDKLRRYLRSPRPEGLICGCVCPHLPEEAQGSRQHPN